MNRDELAAHLVRVGEIYESQTGERVAVSDLRSVAVVLGTPEPRASEAAGIAVERLRARVVPS